MGAKSLPPVQNKKWRKKRMKQTKRLIPFLMAVMMCVCALVPVTASAEATTPEVFLYEDFSSWTAVPSNKGSTVSHKQHKGLRANDFYAPEANSGATYVKDGVLHLEAKGGKGAMDVLIIEGNLASKNITEDFTLSMELKLVGATWNRGGNDSDFFTFRNSKGTGADKELGTFKYIFTKNGGVGIKADGGDAVSGTLPTDSFTTIEYVFDYDETANVFKSLTLVVNGVKIGTATISVALSAIDQCRMFQTYTAGQGIELDSISIVKGCTSVYEPSEKTEFVGYQTTAAVDNKFDLRLVGVTADADVSAYTKVGFDVEVKIGDKTLTKTQDIGVVFDKIVASETADGYKEYTAAELDGAHIFALTCKNIPTNQGAITFKVTTYYQIGANATVAGETVTFTVDPSANIPNAEVK